MLLNVLANTEAYLEEKKSIALLYTKPINDLLYNEDFGSSILFKECLNKSFADINTFIFTAYIMKIIILLLNSILISIFIIFVYKIKFSIIEQLGGIGNIDGDNIEQALQSEPITNILKKFNNIYFLIFYAFVPIFWILFTFFFKDIILCRISKSITDNLNMFILDNLSNIDSYQTEKFGGQNILQLSESLTKYLTDYFNCWISINENLWNRIISIILLILFFALCFDVYQAISNKIKLSHNIGEKIIFYGIVILVILLLVCDILLILLELYFVNYFNRKNEQFFTQKEVAQTYFSVSVFKTILNYVFGFSISKLLLMLIFCAFSFIISAVIEKLFMNSFILILYISLHCCEAILRQMTEIVNKEYIDLIGINGAIGTIYFARNISYLFDSFQTLLIKNRALRNIKIESQLDSIKINIKRVVGGKYIKFNESIDLNKPNIIILTGNEIMAMGLFDVLSGISTDKLKKEEVMLTVNKGNDKNNQVEISLSNCKSNIFEKIMYTHPKVTFPNIILEDLISIYCPDKSLWAYPLQTVCLDKEISTLFFYLYLSGGQKSRYGKFWNILQANKKSLQDKNKLALIYHISQGLDDNTTKKVMENLINFQDFNTKIIYVTKFELEVFKNLKIEIPYKIIELEDF